MDSGEVGADGMGIQPQAGGMLDGNMDNNNSNNQGGYMDSGGSDGGAARGGGGGDDGGGDDVFEPQEWMAPDHPLMARVQKALLKQLTLADERLTLELRERTSEVDKIQKKREVIGVELYNYQQALAKLQMQLEGTHEKYNGIHQMRIEGEDMQKKQLSLVKVGDKHSHETNGQMLSYGRRAF